MTYPASQCDPHHCTCYYGDVQGHANLHGVAGTCCFCGTVRPAARRTSIEWVAKLRQDGTWEFIPSGKPLGHGCLRITATVEMPTSYVTPEEMGVVATRPQEIQQALGFALGYAEIHEWMPQVPGGPSWCSMCGAFQTEGHATTCGRGQAFAQARAVLAKLEGA